MIANRWSTLCALIVAAGPATGVARVRSEVWQLVTFRFLPGKSAEAMRIYREDLRPIYSAMINLSWFRGFREVESPEPLDMVAVSGYADLAAMDRANEELRRAGEGGRSALTFYGMLSDLSAGHHDQFVELDPTLGDLGPPPVGLVAYEFLRVVPGGGQAFERLVRRQLRPWERARQPNGWIATGRMLISDGWTHLRVHRLASLADWQTSWAARQASPGGVALDRLVAARKVVLLRDLSGVAAK